MFINYATCFLRETFSFVRIAKPLSNASLLSAPLPVNFLYFKPTITPLSTNNSDSFYRDMDDIIRNTILTSHRITSPKLLGIETPGSLGSKDEVVEGYEHFLRTSVVPIQEQLLGEFEKLLFMRDKQLHKLEIVQNEIFETKPTEEIKPVI